MKFLKTTIPCLMILALSACGGGSGDSSQVPQPNKKPIRYDYDVPADLVPAVKKENTLNGTYLQEHVKVGEMAKTKMYGRAGNVVGGKWGASFVSSDPHVAIYQSTGLKTTPQQIGALESKTAHYKGIAIDHKQQKGDLEYFIDFSKISGHGKITGIKRFWNIDDVEEIVLQETSLPASDLEKLRDQVPLEGQWTLRLKGEGENGPSGAELLSKLPGKPVYTVVPLGPDANEIRGNLEMDVDARTILFNKIGFDYLTYTNIYYYGYRQPD